MSRIANSTSWSDCLAKARQATPEAFTSDGSAPLNLIAGEWNHPGQPRRYISPVDGSELGALPMVDLQTAHNAVHAASNSAKAWRCIDLDERRRKVSECLDMLRAHRDLIARLLMWEIGKPIKQAQTDVDRCIDGVQWYVDNIESMIEGRKPLGLVSNIASWNYPYSVLVHSVLVQALAGNSVIAKTPTDGGLFALTVGFALARRAGLPVSLVSGAGGSLGPALVRGDGVDCLAFVGGRSNGRAVAATLCDVEKRYMIEMEGINAYGVWEFSDWQSLASQLRKGYDYGKQRCTAYARFVVQRKLFPKFLDAYLNAANQVRVGNPVVVAAPDDPLPELDFGPLINRAQAETLRSAVADGIAGGAVPLYDGEFDPSAFLPGQDMGAYCAPAALLGVPRNNVLYHREPFGPVDTIVLVDTIDELIAEVNVSNGALVASVACDDPEVAGDIAVQLRAFKVGINSLRSRGDREEVFGGIGQSWRGCFVGGKYLVEAVTVGEPSGHLYGNFPEYTRLPLDR